MKKILYSVLFLTSNFAAIANEAEYEQSPFEITSPEACDQDPRCPRDSHPIGENCPHQDPSPY